MNFIQTMKDTIKQVLNPEDFQKHKNIKRIMEISNQVPVLQSKLQDYKQGYDSHVKSDLPQTAAEFLKNVMVLKKQIAALKQEREELEAKYPDWHKAYSNVNIDYSGL